jgi:hypothetical protein
MTILPRSTTKHTAKHVGRTVSFQDLNHVSKRFSLALVRIAALPRLKLVRVSPLATLPLILHRSVILIWRLHLALVQAYSAMTPLTRGWLRVIFRLSRGAQMLNEMMLSATVSFVVSSLLTVAVTTFRNRLPPKRLWRIKFPRKLLVCLASSASTDTGEYTRFASGIGQISALGIITPSLSQAYGEFDSANVRLSHDSLNHRIEDDVIALGGPKNNSLARDVLERLALRLPVSMDEHQVIRWREYDGSISEYEARIADHVVKEDYGVIIRAENPYRPGRTLILLCGSHTFGVTAAARYFVNEYQKLRHWRAGEFVTVVKTVVRDGYAAYPTLVRTQRLLPAETSVRGC